MVAVAAECVDRGRRFEMGADVVRVGHADRTVDLAAQRRRRVIDDEFEVGMRLAGDAPENTSIRKFPPYPFTLLRKRGPIPPYCHPIKRSNTHIAPIHNGIICIRRPEEAGYRSLLGGFLFKHGENATGARDAAGADR